MTDDRLRWMVGAFLKSRRRQPRRFDVPQPLWPTSVSEGYAVLQGVHRGLENAGNRRTGFKVACTTDATRRAMGVEEPAYSGLFESDRYQTLRAAVSSLQGRTAGYECEMAVRIAQEPRPRPADWQDVLCAVDSVAVACEIVINRYGDPLVVGSPSLIADDWFQAGYVVGPWVPIASAPRDLARLAATFAVNDAEPASGRSGDVMGHPITSVAWLVNALATSGDRLRAGDIVLTGSIMAPVWLDDAPRSMSMSIDGLGTLDLSEYLE